MKVELIRKVGDDKFEQTTHSHIFDILIKNSMMMLRKSEYGRLESIDVELGDIKYLKITKEGVLDEDE